MASINVTEKDFEAVATAAMDAEESGDMDHAKALDKVARKINAALSAQTAARANPFPTYRTKTSWRDMPSTLKDD